MPIFGVAMSNEITSVEVAVFMLGGTHPEAKERSMSGVSLAR